MHFNPKNPVDGYSIPIPFAPSFESNRLISIDTLIIDDHSRLTITRNLKKVLPIMPKDAITVFQDRYNKDIIFMIQRENKVIDNLIIRRNYSRDKTSNKKSLENSQIDLHTRKEKPESTLHDINILLVDDESDLLKVYELFLQSEGYYNIQIFSDSRKTVKHLADLKNPRHYGLAIIDIRMPFINGIQLYYILKIFNPNIKVLFVTALDAADELISMYQIAHEDILRKPCEQQDFITTVNNAVLMIPEK
jgi:CheY-like chemotaxis protein